MAVRDLQMAEAATAQIINRVQPPVGALAGRLAQAAAVGDAKHPAMPARRGAGPLQQPVDHSLQERRRAVQPLDQRLIRQPGNAPLTGPAGDALQRIAATTPGHRQTQQIGGRAQAARALQRLGLTGQRFQIQPSRQTPQQGREMIDNVARCLQHLR
jgi:hypothetical protein